MRKTLISLVLLGMAGVVFLSATGTLDLDNERTVRLMVLVGFFLVVVLNLLPRYGTQMPSAVRDLAIWAVIVGALVGGYTYRTELKGMANRVLFELSPPGSVFRLDDGSEGEGAIRLRRRPEGQFLARTTVNDEPLNMLVDTGASSVTLTAADARRVGIDIKALAYTVAVSTANGQAYAAPVRLKRIAIGSIVKRDVDALVAKPGVLGQSLLGMSFLRRLRSYEFQGDFLTLRE